MSSIIIDKLKQIDKASRGDKQSTSVTGSSSTESTSSEKKTSAHRESSDQPSSDQTSAMRTDESEYYEAYHIAKVWAAKLRKLAHCQKLYAEKAIHDILFEAQLGNLHKSSVKINGKGSLTKRTPSDSNSHSSYTSKSTNSAPLYGSIEPSHSEQVVGASSEVLISESYPNDNCLLSSESHADNATSKLNCTLHKQNFIVAASPNKPKKLSPNTQSRESLPFDEENQGTGSTSSVENAATNTPDCILKQLSRYIRDCYDNCKNYLPPTQL